MFCQKSKSRPNLQCELVTKRRVWLDVTRIFDRTHEIYILFFVSFYDAHISPLTPSVQHEQTILLPLQ